jgi:hypothetical protein
MQESCERLSNNASKEPLDRRAEAKALVAID